MDHQRHQQMLKYQPEQWRNDEYILSREDLVFAKLHRSDASPDPLDQSRLLELLGLINYKILTGNRVYVEVGGIVYKTLYGGYWRSVFTGIQHYQLRCQEVSTWTEEPDTTDVVDLPISYSRDGWTAKGHSLSLMLSRD